ncbi:MAG TPA: DUF2752 domain-containing protein [Gemmataceae bacterium]|nr:DUF2752 domain-containing protein [Gemmataceae bacterium]
MALLPGRLIGIVPRPLQTIERFQQPSTEIPRMAGWVRVALLLIAGGLVAILVLAVKLDPYGPDGRPLRMETHRQLGLPPCTFYEKTGLPCPSCGLTTSFALLVRGDIGNSLRANAIGTLMALFSLVIIPWNLLCAFRGRLHWVRSLERALTWIVGFTMALLLGRWIIILLMHWLFGTGF